ncbi:MULTISPECIES: hypothetical protein [unclassified Pseudomonas]|uniref:hypothetical protein n=1 Tax=unclassified Pseudomonas TaxID=196821 RepID=UPI00244A8BBF|nr:MULTISPECIES: hypothetical protein [unclassified Pseudomonas]MDH0894431.1 hypothetical protein [Pseudomonas sp. GD03875]MDH1063274.1 hypothetical protein [Pseudomonas sp. GD03985]
MHADRDDAPFYIRKKRSQLGRVVAILAAGSAITLGALMLIPAPKQIKAPFPAAALAAKTPQRVIANQAVKTLRQERQEPIAEIYKPTPATEQAAVKQTSFDDSNYIPKGAANVVSYPKPIEVAAAPKNDEMKVTVVKQKTRIRDYCPGKEGSLERRNCRTQVSLGRHD